MAKSKTPEVDPRAVMQAFINAGFSENQAKALTAEVGRENNFYARYVFGTHSDPANKATNVGFFSWQGSRKDALLKHLASRGVYDPKTHSMQRSQATLNAMAEFAKNEMLNNPAYKTTKDKFLANPNIDYQTANRILGKNYIRWAYDNPKYASGHTNRDRWYRYVGGKTPTAMTGSSVSSLPQSQKSNSSSQSAPTLATSATNSLSSNSTSGQPFISNALQRSVELARQANMQATPITGAIQTSTTPPAWQLYPLDANTQSSISAPLIDFIDGGDKDV